MGKKLLSIPDNNITFSELTDNSCYRGGILTGLSQYAYSAYGTTLTKKFFTSSHNIDKLLEHLKRSSNISIRQYLFAAGLASSYKQMENSTRSLSSDDVAKTMFAHLIDLIKPTCTNIRLDITGPGPVSQLSIKKGLTGKLEMAYSSFTTSYNYTLVLVFEMKSVTKLITPFSLYPEEIQLLAEMAYCLKRGGREFVLGILFIAENVVIFVLHECDDTYKWTKLKITDSVINDFFSVGTALEQLIYHSLHNTLQITSSLSIDLKTQWKPCKFLKSLYIEDEMCITDSGLNEFFLS